MKLRPIYTNIKIFMHAATRKLTAFCE